MSIKENIVNNTKEMQNIAAEFARQILRKKGKTLRPGSGQAAIVLGLTGDLGAGKTTFLQGFARGLGIKEVVNSPTFVIMKKFQIPNSDSHIPTPNFKFFYHLDCYRLEKPEEILALGFAKIILNPQNIVAIEWPEKIAEFLPKNIININFIHRNSTERELNIDAPGL